MLRIKTEPEKLPLLTNNPEQGRSPCAAIRAESINTVA